MSAMLAIASLTVREALRRRLIAAFAVISLALTRNVCSGRGVGSSRM